MMTPRKLIALIQAAFVSLFAMAALASPMLVQAAAASQASNCNAGTLTISSGIACGAPTSASATPLFGAGGLFQKIADILIFVIGAISVLMIIIGALRYTLSAGNPSATTGAKDTILYAVVGLIVATLAFAIVQFVVSKIGYDLVQTCQMCYYHL